MAKRDMVEEKTYKLNQENLVGWLIIIISLYLMSLRNIILYHTLVELFSVLIAYIVFLIIWKSKGFILNRYLIFIGIAYFFTGSYDLLHTLTLPGMGVFPGLDSNPSTQFWIIARYLESTSFLIASLFLIQNTDDEMNNSILLKNSLFARRTFYVYTIITASLLISVLYLKIFPTCYVEGSGETPFNIISDYVTSLILLCSLVLLYKEKDKFKTKVFSMLALAIVFTLLGDAPFIAYNHMEGFLSVITHFFKAISFYYLYLAIVETGFDEPYSRLSRKLAQKEEALKQEASFLTSEQNLIYSLLGVNKNIPEKMTEAKYSQESEKDYSSFLQNFSGILFQLDENLIPMLMDGSIEEITGYSKEDFLSKSVKWADIIIPEDLSIFYKKVEQVESNPKKILEIEYRIRRKDGEVRWVREVSKQVSGNKLKYQGSIHDITQRKRIEENLKMQEEARKKEIHHRIKNNLQVISSLLDLQYEKFRNRKNITDSEVMTAFRESQSRVTSMALIHEELHKSEGIIDKLNFSQYIKKLADNLLLSYKLGNTDVGLNMYLEENFFLDIDTAIPLGIIINELVSNSLKYAFRGRDKGEIKIKFSRDEKRACKKEGSNIAFVLSVSDNGVGIPEDLEIEDLDSLGLQLVTLLVDQLDGELELKRNNGTEFIIRFTATEEK